MDGSLLNTIFSAPVVLVAAGAFAALFVVLLVLVLRRAGPATKRFVLPIGGGVVVALVVLFLFGRLAENDRAAERRALEQREANLAAQALAPGSMLGCLDSAAGDAVESGCEAAVFAEPRSVAAAVAYVTARLSLLADGLDYARRVDSAFADRLSGLRRSVELDRFGIAAHVLASRDGCTAERCATFQLLRDPSALKANLRVRAYNKYVERHATSWANGMPLAERQPPVAVAPSPPSPSVASLPPEPASPKAPVSSRFDFPSAASIPPVSIMNAEPPLPAAAAAANAAAPAAEAAPAVPMPPRRPKVQAPPPADQ